MLYYSILLYIKNQGLFLTYTKINFYIKYLIKKDLDLMYLNIKDKKVKNMYF